MACRFYVGGPADGWDKVRGLGLGVNCLVIGCNNLLMDFTVIIDIRVACRFYVGGPADEWDRV